MVINVADVLKFPDIVLGQEVTIEGWKPLLANSKDFHTLIPDNPHLLSTEETIDVKMGNTLHCSFASNWDACLVQISGKVLEISSKKREVRLVDITQIMFEIRRERMREYILPHGILPNTIKFKTQSIPIEDLLPHIDLYMGGRVRIVGNIFLSAIGHMMVHKNYITSPTTINRIVRLTKSRLGKTNMVKIHQHSIFTHGISSTDQYTFCTSKNHIWTQGHTEIIGTLMPTDEPYFPAQLDDAVLIIRDEEKNTIQLFDLY